MGGEGGDLWRCHLSTPHNILTENWIGLAEPTVGVCQSAYEIPLSMGAYKLTAEDAKTVSKKILSPLTSKAWMLEREIDVYVAFA